MKNKNTLILGLMVFAVLVWFISRPNPKLSTASENKSAAVTEAPFAHPPAAMSAPLKQPVAALATPAKVLSFALPTEIQNEIRTCLQRNKNFPAVHYGRGFALDNVIQDLSDRGATRIPEESMVNLQVRRSSGELETLHVEPYSPEDNPRTGTYQLGQKIVRVFKADAEGLPIALPFPESLKRPSLAEISHAFVGADPVTYRERRYHQTIANGIAVVVDEENGHAVELQINTKAGVLGCSWTPDTHKPSCACK